MDARHAPLELEDPRGGGRCIRQLREAQHRSDMRAVAAADLLHLGRCIEIVVAVGHLEAALHQEGRVTSGIIEVLGHPQPEEIRSMEVSVVQYVDVGAQRRTQRPRERRPVGDGVDRFQRRAQRLETLAFDGRLVHEGRVVIADLGRFRPRRGGAGGIADGICGALLGELGELGESTVGAAVGGDLGPLEPEPVGEAIEIVPGRDRSVDAAEVQAASGGRGGRHGRPGRCGECGDGGRHREQPRGPWGRRSGHACWFSSKTPTARPGGVVYTGGGIESPLVLREYSASP